VLFLAEAGAAAALAAGGAILGLYLSARRRRYEYAALVVTGVRSRSLLASLVAEQLIVVVFGLLVGVAAGLAAVEVALRAVPEFLVAPAAPALSYLPPNGQLAALLAFAAAVVIGGALLASLALIRSVRLDELRAGPA
jgi:ABC-type antimicrobial peptide transport system permease subunit